MGWWRCRRALGSLARSAQWRPVGNRLCGKPRFPEGFRTLAPAGAAYWTETVTRVAETGVPDADYEAAAGEFSDKELADLTYAIGLMSVFNRLGVSFRSTPAAASKA